MYCVGTTINSCYQYQWTVSTYFYSTKIFLYSTMANQQQQPQPPNQNITNNHILSSTSFYIVRHTDQHNGASPLVHRVQSPPNGTHHYQQIDSPSDSSLREYIRYLRQSTLDPLVTNVTSTMLLVM